MDQFGLNMNYTSSSNYSTLTIILEMNFSDFTIG
jgi:hypothetical protein